MHDAAFTQAALPQPFTVLKMPLRRFAPGHWLHLQRRRNPLADGKPGEFHHLLEAVLICCQSWQELERGDALLPLKTKFLLWRNRGCHVQSELNRWFEYYIEHCSFPPTQPIPRSADSAPSRPAGAPHVLRVIQFLLLNGFCHTEAEAMDYPLGLAQWHYCAFYENEGTLRIKNTDDLYRDHLREFMAGQQPTEELLKQAKEYANLLCQA